MPLRKGFQWNTCQNRSEIKKSRESDAVSLPLPKSHRECHYFRLSINTSCRKRDWHPEEMNFSSG